jgi:limonene 1,2-monooxygenase
VELGLRDWIEYFARVNPTASSLAPQDSGPSDPVDQMVDSGRAVIGTPDDAIAMVERLAEQSGGFGCLLLLAHNWADFERTKQSYALLARHVLPHFNQANQARAASLASYTERNVELIGRATAAALATVQQHSKDVAAAQGVLEKKKHPR